MYRTRDRLGPGRTAAGCWSVRWHAGGDWTVGARRAAWAGQQRCTAPAAAGIVCSSATSVKLVQSRLPSPILANVTVYHANMTSACLACRSILLASPLPMTPTVCFSFHNLVVRNALSKRTTCEPQSILQPDNGLRELAAVVQPENDEEVPARHPC